MPTTLDAVVVTAMAKSKDDRYPTCSAFAGAALAALEAGTGRSYAVSLPPVPAAPPPPPAPTPATDPYAGPASYHQPELAAQVMPAAPYPPTPPSYPPPAPAVWAPGPYDSTPTAVQRQKPVTAIALIVAALLVAGGGTVAALIISKHNDTPSATVASKAVDNGPGPQVSTPTETVTTTTSVTTDTPPPTPTPNTSNPITPSVPKASASSKVKGRMEGYWNAIDGHQWNKAYAYWAPANAPAENSWISSHIRDGVQSVTADFAPASVSGSTATTDVITLTTVSTRCGTQHWTGSFTMTLLNGVWRIADSNISTQEKC
jgi:hypothetical protein